MKKDKNFIPKNIKEITLFLLWGHGDSMNFTWAPRLLKNKLKDIKVRVVVKNSHKYLFSTNPFVDYIEGVTDDIAVKYRREPRIGNWINEINMWVLANNLPKPSRDINNWDIPYEMSKQINNFLRHDIITSTDNLLPEFFYTDEEKLKAKNFINENRHFAIIETEFFSYQSNFTQKQIIDGIKDTISECNFKVFTSSMNCKIDLLSLNSYNLREVSLINQGSLIFLGLNSGVSVSTLERTLINPRKRIIASKAPNIISLYKRYKPNNTISVPASEYINIINKELKLCSEEINNNLVIYPNISQE